jgi:hypothetical protein
VAGPWTAQLLAPLRRARAHHAGARAQIAFFRYDPRLRYLHLYRYDLHGYFRPHGDDLTLAGLGGAKRDGGDPDGFREASDP